MRKGEFVTACLKVEGNTIVNFNFINSRKSTGNFQHGIATA